MCDHPVVVFCSGQDDAESGSIAVRQKLDSRFHIETMLVGLESSDSREQHSWPQSDFSSSSLNTEGLL